MKYSHVFHPPTGLLRTQNLLLQIFERSELLATPKITVFSVISDNVGAFLFGSFLLGKQKKRMPSDSDQQLNTFN